MLRRHLVLGMMVLSLVLAACGGDESSDNTAATESTAGETAEGGDGALEATTVRIAMAEPEFDTTTDAKWLALLEEAGITVETFDFPAGPDQVRALAAGEVDLTNTAPLPTMQFIQESGGGLTVIAVELLKTDYYLVTTPELTGLESLEGATIGISAPGDISDSLTRLVLEASGLDVSGMNFVQIGGTSARLAALIAGEIDGGAAHAADAFSAAAEAGLNPLVRYSEFIETYAQRFLGARNEWLAEHPNLAQLIVDKLIEANRWAQDNEDEFMALSAEIAPDVPEDIRRDTYRLFADNGFFGVNGGLEAIDGTFEVEQGLGNLSGEMPALEEWVDPRFVDDYLARNGEY